MTREQAPVDETWLQYPTTLKIFNTFDNLKNLKFHVQMLTPQMRFQIYWEHSKVVNEMADTFQIFSRMMFFTLKMGEQYRTSRGKYVTYFTNFVCNIDVYLQEDQLVYIRSGLLILPVPTYMSNN